MGVREETLNMLRNGLSPKAISTSRGVTLSTTLGYLNQLIGQGELRRSDVLFSIAKPIRDAIIETDASESNWVICERLRKRGIDIDEDDVIVVRKYGDAGHALGDMYEDIRAIERHLHEVIRDSLEEEYGKGELNWWRKGIPIQTRQNCQLRREEDEEPVEEPYCYTNFLDLWNILDYKWNVLQSLLPDKLSSNKHYLKGKMFRLNQIRRNVMHPIRGVVPSEDDFEFVRDFKNILLPHIENDLVVLADEVDSL